MGYTPRTPVNPDDLAISEVRATWREKQMVELAFFDASPPYTAVGVFIDHPIEYDQLVQQSVPVEYGGATVRICSVEHLTELKEKALRPKDLEDLKFLYRIFDETAGRNHATTSD